MKNIPLRARINTSIFIALCVIIVLTLLNYFRDKPHNFPIYLVIAIVIGALDFFIYKNKR